MKLLRTFINPLIVFIGIQLLWIVLVVFWIKWFVGSHQKVRELAEKYSPELLEDGINWFILVEGLVLLVAILAGTYVIFLFWTRQTALLKAQRNFIAQVSHELKSPLASLRLHLETIRRRRPSAEKMETFLDTMMADTNRLDTLINNLLAANRMERKGLRLSVKPGNLSEFLEGYFGAHQYSLPRAGTMELDIAPDIWVKFDPDSLEIVMRNILENAVLYSDSPPRLKAELRRERQRAHFILSDKGRGIEKADLKNLFHMFYRVRHSSAAIRGSGLGLYIVWGIIRRHRGKVWLESAGKGEGAQVHIELPLVKRQPTRNYER